MRKLITFALVVAAGFAGYHFFLNAPPASADERALADLEHQFDSANQSMMQASRSAGASGLDTTADIEAARAAVRRVDSDLKRLKGSLATDAARARADRLMEKVRAFLEATE
ncbi:MAG: hypothetical protein ACREAA_15875 [Candidatus Polarisedimenticolia bacterium]